MSDPIKVKFIIPVGYRGIFKLVIDSTEQTSPRKDNGILVYEIPDNGVLKIRQSEPLSDWHETFVEFSDHTPLKAGQNSPVQPYDEKEIKLYHVLSDSEGNIYFLVGTEAEFAKVLGNEFDLHLGGIHK